MPRAKLIRALLPHVKRLEPFDVVVGVHLRTGYADWQYRNGARYFERMHASLASPENQTVWGVRYHWAALDSCLQARPKPCEARTSRNRRSCRNRRTRDAGVLERCSASSRAPWLRSVTCACSSIGSHSALLAAA